MSEVLEEELALFNKRRLEWCKKHKGKWVIIRSDEVGGFYPTWESAFRAGCQMFGTNLSFLVKEVREVDEIFAIF